MLFVRLDVDAGARFSEHISNDEFSTYYTSTAIVLMVASRNGFADHYLRAVFF